MHTTLVLHGVDQITWGSEYKLQGANYMRELIFKSPAGEVRVEVYSSKPISIQEGEGAESCSDKCEGPYGD